MKSLEERDRALIEAAGAAIRRNYMTAKTSITP